jgi:hypothetical protein
VPDLGDSPVPHIPTIRPARPKFSRPGISLSRSEKREWQEIKARQVFVGDVVPGVGLVSGIDVSVLGELLIFENVIGQRTELRPDDEVMAFGIVRG